MFPPNVALRVVTTSQANAVMNDAFCATGDRPRAPKPISACCLYPERPIAGCGPSVAHQASPAYCTFLVVRRLTLAADQSCDSGTSRHHARRPTGVRVLLLSALCLPLLLVVVELGVRSPLGATDDFHAYETWLSCISTHRSRELVFGRRPSNSKNARRTLLHYCHDTAVMDQYALRSSERHGLSSTAGSPQTLPPPRVCALKQSHWSYQPVLLLAEFHPSTTEPSFGLKYTTSPSQHPALTSFICISIVTNPTSQLGKLRCTYLRSLRTRIGLGPLDYRPQTPMVLEVWQQGWNKAPPQLQYCSLAGVPLRLASCCTPSHGRLKTARSPTLLDIGYL